MARCEPCLGTGAADDHEPGEHEDCGACDGTGQRPRCPNHVGVAPEATKLVGARYYCEPCADAMERFLEGAAPQLALGVTL